MPKAASCEAMPMSEVLPEVTNCRACVRNNIASCPALPHFVQSKEAQFGVLATNVQGK